MTELFTLVSGLALYFGAMALLFSPALLLAWGEKAPLYGWFDEVDQLERDLEALAAIYMAIEVDRKRAISKHSAIGADYKP